jgi:magnesium chelatase subunit I
LGTDGLRGELTVLRAVRALAAFEGKKKANLGHLKKIAPMALGHRLRRNPLDDSSSNVRIERAMQEFFADTSK